MISRLITVNGLLTVNIRHTKNLLKIREMHLLLNKALINGNWVSADDNKVLTVLNPADGSTVGNVPDMTVNETQKAIEAANAAFHSERWSNLTAKDRSALLKVSTYRFFHSTFYIIYILVYRNGLV